MRKYWCRSCGMVRKAKHPPICRHGDPMLVARWMEILPKHHPSAKESS